MRSEKNNRTSRITKNILSIEKDLKYFRSR